MNVHSRIRDDRPQLTPISAPRRWWQFVERHLPNLALFLLVLLLIAFVLFPYMIVTVPSGQIGVLWKRFAGGTVLDPRLLKDEGFHIVLPWDKVYLYDLRVQSLTENYNAISSDGVSLTATVNIRYRLKRDFDPDAAPGGRPELHQFAWSRDRKPDARGHCAIHRRTSLFHGAAGNSGQDPRTRGGEVGRQDDGARGRDVIQRSDAGYDHALRYPPVRHRVAGGSSSPRSIARPSSTIFPRNTSSVWNARKESRSASRSRRKEYVISSRSSRQGGIADSYLRWRGIEATLQLAQSTNSKVVVIGSTKDGLPIILGNADTVAPQRAPPDDGGSPPKERTTAAGPALQSEQTPASGLTAPHEKISARVQGGHPG